MKLVLLICLNGLLAAGTAQAFFKVSPLPQEKVRVIRDETTESQLDLNQNTLRCSALGYSFLELKVSVPDLKFLAVFDHVNPGETEPCMSAGACRPGLEPANILTSEPTTRVQLRVVLKEVYELFSEEKTCHRTLVEEVSTLVRGVPFYHTRSADLGNFPYDLCVKL